MSVFSVLIANYNNWNYFQDCYKTLQNQTFQDFEIVVVDDGSTDGSYEKFLELSKIDSKIKLYQNEENKGVGYTKKKLIEKATGEICGFVDPDDALSENALEICLSVYKSSIKIVATYSKFYICDEDLNVQKISPKAQKIKNNDSLFFNIFFQVGHFFTFKKEAYLKTSGINTSLKFAEDLDMYLKLYEIGEFYFIDKPLYFYRIHNNSLTNIIDKKKDNKIYWHQALLHALERRNILFLYGKEIQSIKSLPSFIHQKQNTLKVRIIRYLKKII